MRRCIERGKVVSIYLPARLIAEARARRLNVSAVCREAVRAAAALPSADLDAELRNTEEKLTALREIRATRETDRTFLDEFVTDLTKHTVELLRTSPTPHYFVKSWIEGRIDSDPRLAELKSRDPIGWEAALRGALEDAVAQTSTGNEGGRE